MNLAIADRPAPARLPAFLERQILKRTWGLVRHLRVDSDDNRIVVHGTAPSYYLKQLVLQAVIESLAGTTGLPVSLNVNVRAGTAEPG